MKLGIFITLVLVALTLFTPLTSAYMFVSGDPNPYLLRPSYGCRGYYCGSMMYPGSYRSPYSPLYYGGYNPYYGTYGYYYSYSDPMWKYAVLDYFGRTSPGWR